MKENNNIVENHFTGVNLCKRPCCYKELILKTFINQVNVGILAKKMNAFVHFH